MKRNLHKNPKKIFRSLGMLLGGGMLSVACVAYPGGYSETDGVYYDPSTDTLPVEEPIYAYENQVGEVYSYDEPGIIEKSAVNEQRQKTRYWDEEALSTDWGNYAGSEIYYSDYGYSYPWSFGYSPYYWNRGLGLHFSFGMGWGYGYNPYFGYSPWDWGYSPFYSPYSFYPWGYGYYNPYYGYYSPYYGYGNYYGGYYGNYYNDRYRRPHVKSGADGNYRNPQTNTMNRNTGFRNSSPGTLRTVRPNGSSSTLRRGTFTPSQRTNSGVRNQRVPQPRMEDRRPERRVLENRSDSGWRNNSNGGFRNDGGFRSSSSSGGFSSGTRSSGTRGGFR